jgi:hypothetical protein
MQLLLPARVTLSAAALVSLCAAPPAVRSAMVSRQTPAGYFCDTVLGSGANGYFEIYNTVTGLVNGCLNSQARWVVDGSCAVFNTVPYSQTYGVYLPISFDL